MTYELCLVKWWIAISASALTSFINFVLDMLFIYLLNCMSKEMTQKFLFPYDDPEKPMHFRTQRLRDTMAKSEIRPPKPSYTLGDGQISQSSMADILTPANQVDKTA
ncbi:hypothetical protein VKS41_006196 [Umbelopsis sp. WA50703]